MSSSTDKILRHLEQHGVNDKDASSRAHSSSNHSRHPVAKSKGDFRMTVDLHGKTSVAAESAVRRAVEQCCDRGIKRLLIIHGIGLHSSAQSGPVLKNLVMTMLENELSSRVCEWRPAPARDGGEGATEVVVRGT